MFCSNCGTKVLDGAGFCQQCGADLRQEVAQEQNPKQAWQQENVNGWVISPYYRKQFEKIAMGQKPNFNWAALFFNGWNQLYNGCTRVFCRTFLPIYIAMAINSILFMLGSATFNTFLMTISGGLWMILPLCSLVMVIINGFKFNTWYYNDIMNNPGKKRSRKGVFILLACIVAFVILGQVAGYIVVNKWMSDIMSGTDLDDVDYMYDETQFETTNGEESTSQEVDADDDSNSVLDSMVIGETRSYDDIYGNMEVTLDSISFVEKTSDIMGVGYDYPDEGNVFLQADITVRNIGTQDASLIGTRIVYDGEYEFREYRSKGDVVNIPPLSAPKKAVNIYEVPMEVMESDKPLALNIGDDANSFVIRASDDVAANNQATDSAVQSTVVAEYPGQIVFNGVPVSSFFESSVESIMNDWGTPMEYEAGAGINYCTYDGITFNFDAFDAIYTIDIDPSKCVIDGATLDKHNADLLNILGTPTDEGWVPGGYSDVYQMRYENFQGGISFNVSFVTPDDVASNVRFWK